MWGGNNDGGACDGGGGSVEDSKLGVFAEGRGQIQWAEKKAKERVTCGVDRVRGHGSPEGGRKGQTLWGCTMCWSSTEFTHTVIKRKLTTR